MAHMKHFEHLKIALDSIKSATNNFSNDSCIGKGGFGKVYKGEIVHSERQMMVALKRLDRAFGQGDPEFWKEIMMLSLYKHENIVSLLGYCDDCDEKILVYEYVPNKSLDLYLNNHHLTWVRRLNICIGAARGLAHLHSAVGTQQRVLHRDIKSSNILLDEDWNAKISDFGLSKFGPANQQITFLVSNPVGTFGYCDPLYAETGSLTKESDVYSFGVVLFEVLCGRLCMGNNDKRRPLIGLARQCYEQNTLNEIIYDSIKDEIDGDSLKAFTEIAYRCLKRDREERPLMTEIVKALETALEHQVLDRALKPPVGILKVKVLRAMNLKDKNHRLDTWSGPYTEVRLTGDHELQFKKTTVKRKTLNPKWFEEFNFDVKYPNVQALQVAVYHQKWIGKEKMGMNVVALKDLTPQVPKVLILDLLMNMDHHNDDTPQGQIVIEVMYKPFTEDKVSSGGIQDASASQKIGGVFSVKILGWENIEGEHHDNPYIRLHFQGQKREYEPLKYDDPDLRWRSIFPYRLEKPPINERLHLEVVTTPRMRLIYPEECLGYVDIDVADVVNNKQVNQIYHLLDSENNGRLHLELEWKTFEEIERDTPLITGLLKLLRH